MTTCIALLRGINVSGQKKVPMAALREILSSLGFLKLTTYIQSGNIVFQTLEQDQTVLEEKISKAIVNAFGFEVPVVVKSERELNSIIKANPFTKEEQVYTYFTVLHNKPNENLVAGLSKESYPDEPFFVTSDCVYVYPKNGYGKAKCNTNFFERKLKVPATTRNFKTMQKLLYLCSDL